MFDFQLVFMSITYCHVGRCVAPAVSRRLPAMAAWVRTLYSHVGSRADFHQVLRILLPLIHSNNFSTIFPINHQGMV
jgi:hypothetical protein